MADDLKIYRGALHFAKKFSHPVHIHVDADDNRIKIVYHNNGKTHTVASARHMQVLSKLVEQEGLHYKEQPK